MTQKTREAVAVFDDLAKLDEAVADLETENFPRHAISVLGNKQKVEDRFGTGTVDPKWLEDNPNAPRGISVRPEEKTIGATLLVAVPAYIAGCAGILIANPAPNSVLLGAVAIGSVIGAAIGGAALFIFNQKLNKRIEKQIRKGGLLLWVSTSDSEREKTAIQVLRKHGGRHVHIHSIAR